MQGEKKIKGKVLSEWCLHHRHCSVTGGGLHEFLMLYGTNKYFQLTGSGDTGHLVVSAPSPVEEDLKLTPGSATLLPQSMVGGLVRED